MDIFYGHVHFPMWLDILFSRKIKTFCPGSYEISAADGAVCLRTRDKRFFSIIFPSHTKLFLRALHGLLESVTQEDRPRK